MVVSRHQLTISNVFASSPVMVFVHQMVSGAESHQPGVVGGRRDGDGARAADVRVAELVGEELQLIGRETYFAKVRFALRRRFAPGQLLMCYPQAGPLLGLCLGSCFLPNVVPCSLAQLPLPLHRQSCSPLSSPTF